MTKSCPAKDDPDSVWPPFCPNLGAAYFLAVLFGLTLVAHIVQAIIHRKVYSWVVCMSALWQLLAFIFRILSINNVTAIGYYTPWFVLILLAPIWINAYVYMVLGRMVYNYTNNATIFGIKAWRCGLYFVLLDIFAFIVQVSGASMASGDGIPESQIMRGLHIYMGGVGLQQFFILGFIGVAVRFQKQMNLDLPMASKRSPLLLLYILYAALALITVRIIFRLIEYSQGYKSSIVTKEVWALIFDSLPMFIALVLFNVVHPGRIMVGKEADFPSRKARKAASKDFQWGRANKHRGDVTPLGGVGMSFGLNKNSSGMV